jgi:hypothetical protein
VPGAGDTLVFPDGAAKLTNTNDLPAGTPSGALVFNGGGYNINGNAIGLSSGIPGNYGGTVNLDIQLLASQTFQTGTLTGAIDLQGYLLSIN